MTETQKAIIAAFALDGFVLESTANGSCSSYVKTLRDGRTIRIERAHERKAPTAVSDPCAVTLFDLSSIVTYSEPTVWRALDTAYHIARAAIGLPIA